jgi:hypothetical protein
MDIRPNARMGDCSMWKMRSCVFVTATLALTLFLSLASREAFADQTIKLSPGATVEIHGTSAIINNGGGGGPGETGTWNCNCSKTGSCTLWKGNEGLQCVKGTGTCTGSCSLETTTTGVVPGLAAPQSKSSSKPSPQSPSTSK